MKNNDTEAAWHYHNGTKHPYGILLHRFHFYDPANRPYPYKIYKDIQAIVLPLDKSSLGVPALKAISADVEPDESKQVLDLNILSRILYFSGGMTKTINFGRLGEWSFVQQHVQVLFIISKFTLSVEIFLVLKLGSIILIQKK